MASFDIPDEEKSREHLLQELADLRSQLSKKEQAFQAATEELSVLKSDEFSHGRLFQDAFAHVPIGLVILDLKGRFRHANATYCRLTGYTIEDLRQPDFNFQRLTHPDDLGNNLAQMRRLLAGEIQAFHIEKRYFRKDGSIIWVRASASLLKNADGVPIWSLGIVEDIDARKRAEASLQNSEQKFKTFFNSVSDPIYIADMQGNIMEVNEIACRHLGYSREELLNMNAMDIDAPEMARKALQRIGGKGDSEFLVFESVHRHKDGTRFPVEINMRKVQYEGKPCLLGVVRDISERKQAEQDLRESEKRLHRLFEDDLTGDFICTPKGEVLFCNPAYAAMLGFSSPDGAVGENLRTLHPDSAEWDSILAVLKSKGKLERYETWRIRLDGTLIHVVENLVAHFNERNELYEIQGYIYDDTERKKAEQGLQQLNETLELRVAERTELAEARAGQLQKLAMELIEAEERQRGQFAHLLHDDLQQMLAAAKMQLQAVSENLPGELMLKNVEHILEESIAKTRRLSHELSPAVLHQSGLIPGLQWLAGQMKERFGLIVQLESETAPRVEDPTLKLLLFRAVQELLFNIVKHAGVREARLVLAVSDKEIVASVSDQGRGFTIDDLNKSPRKTGFGLLSIQERADYVGGSLTIDSVPGEGSRFTLKIPLPSERLVLKPSASQQQAPFTAFTMPNPTEPTKIIRVLFVDNHAVMRQGLIQLLSKQPGIEVAGEADNGEKAVELIRRTKPDVVLMDISMPVMDGIEATRHIKTHWPEIRVIGLSMHDDDMTVDAMKKSGAETLVSKSASSDEIFKAVYCPQTIPRRN